MTVNFGNNYTTTLSADLAIDGTSAAVESATGAPAASFYAVLSGSVGGVAYTEIVLCTGVSGTTLTITRAQESTTARAWATGATLAHVLTAAGLALFERVANKGAANGYAPLGSDGKVPSEQLPATADVNSDAAAIPGIHLADQGADPTAPGSGYHALYAKSGGLYARDSGGTVVGPFGPAGMTNPMTTLDDLLIGGASGAPARLAKGTDGQVLTVDPTTHHLLWATPATGGMADPTTTKGDLIVHGATTTRLAVGADAQVLTADAAQTAGVKWATPAASLVSPMTTGGDLIYGYAPAIVNMATVGNGASATASSGASPGNVMDANDATYWSPTAVDGEWVKVDLGSARIISQYRVLQEVGIRQITHYAVEYSVDNSTWTVAADVTSAPGDKSGSFAPITARYWRLRVVTSGSFSAFVYTVTLLGSASMPGGATRLAPNTTTARKFLRQVGDGTNSAAPDWDTLQAADVPSLGATGSFTTTDGKTVTVVGGKITSIA